MNRTFLNSSLLKAGVLLMASLTAWTGDAPFDASGWTWQCPVETENAPPGMVGLSVTPEMFDGLQPDLRDLRVLEDGERPVAHMVRMDRPTPAPGSKPHTARLFDFAHEPGLYSRVTAYFGEALKKDHVTVDLWAADYCHRVMVEGTNNFGQWEVLADDLWLIKMTAHGGYAQERLPLPVNTSRYLRITVYNGPDYPDTIRVWRVNSTGLTGTPPARVPTPIQTMTSRVDPESGDTIIDIDTGYRHLPLESVRFDVDTPLFHRAVRVAGRNALTHVGRRRTETGWGPVEQEVPWKPVAKGIIYRMNLQGSTHQTNAIELGGAQFRYMRFIIINGDNPPLPVSALHLERSGATVAFTCAEGKRYTLIGGNPDAQQPNYDLAKTLPDLNVLDLPPVSAGALTPLPLEETPVPWSEQQQWLIWPLLILAAAALGLLIWTNLRRIKKGEFETENGW